MRPACTSHAAERAEAAQALTTRKRPRDTVPRGLYDTARPWLDLGVTIGDCPRCRSTVTISVRKGYLSETDAMNVDD